MASSALLGHAHAEPHRHRPGSADADADADDADLEPPSLGYTMTQPRKRGLLTAIAFLAGTNIVLTTLLFFTTKYAPAPDALPLVYYGVAAASLGVFQIPQWPYRFWCLCRQNGRRSCLPPDPNQPGSWPQRIAWCLRRGDAFQWGFLIGIIIGTAVLTVASSVHGNDGFFPLLILMPAIIFGALGLVGLVVTTVACIPALNKQAFRISNVPKGDPLRPVMYYFWGDLVACEGGGGYQFRTAFDRRYRASPPFRSMLLRLSCLFSISMLALFAVALALTFALFYADPNTTDRRTYEDANWGANMGLLAIWLTLTAWVGIRIAQNDLRAERRWWATSRSTRTGVGRPISSTTLQGDAIFPSATSLAIFNSTSKSEMSG